jgi:hypothetical protein
LDPDSVSHVIYAIYCHLGVLIYTKPTESPIHAHSFLPKKTNSPQALTPNYFSLGGMWVVGPLACCTPRATPAQANNNIASCASAFAFLASALASAAFATLAAFALFF